MKKLTVENLLEELKKCEDIKGSFALRGVYDVVNVGDVLEVSYDSYDEENIERLEGTCGVLVNSCTGWIEDTDEKEAERFINLVSQYGNGHVVLMVGEPVNNGDFGAGSDLGEIILEDAKVLAVFEK